VGQSTFLNKKKVEQILIINIFIYNYPSGLFGLAEGFGVMQQAHFSLASGFGAKHVSQFHFLSMLVKNPLVELANDGSLAAGVVVVVSSCFLLTGSNIDFCGELVFDFVLSVVLEHASCIGLLQLEQMLLVEVLVRLVALASSLCS
jgi:hypothetical protein